MWTDPADVALIALAAICGTLATVGLLRRVQQGRFARRAAEGPDRALLREYRQLQRELTELVTALDSAVDRLADGLESTRAARTPVSPACADHVQDGSAPPVECDEAAAGVEARVSAITGAPSMAVKECIENVRRYAETA